MIARENKDYWPSFNPISLGQALRELKTAIQSIGDEWKEEQILRFSYDKSRDSLVVWCAYCAVHQQFEEGMFGPQYARGRIDAETLEFEIQNCRLDEAKDVVTNYETLRKFLENSDLRLVCPLSRYAE
jgi:hypothetical protein